MMQAAYEPPRGTLGLQGAVARPEPGTLPLRGDLAHIALAGRYLAAHYVVPISCEAARGGEALRLHPRDDATIVTNVADRAAIELLDVTGDWAWVCFGPDGPSGYMRAGALRLLEAQG